jgi:hypothetical protein
MEVDTKTYWLTDRQSQCDFDFDLTLQFLSECGGMKLAVRCELCHEDCERIERNIGV